MAQMSMSCSIYALVDPRNGEIRYIGRAVNPHARLVVHLRDKATSHKVSWITGLRRADLRPLLRIIAVVDLGRANAFEIEMIKRARSLDWPLTNMTAGGEGTFLPESQREAIRRANRERVWSDESRAKASASTSRSRLGLKHSQATKNKIGAAHRGRRASEEARRNMSEAQLRRQAKARMSLIQSNGESIDAG